MMRLLKRLLQRLLVLALGAFSVWLIVFVVFRIADNRLPWILAVAVTYGAAAYVILPRVVLISLKILQRKRGRATRSPATACRAIRSISYSRAPYSSCVPRSRPLAGRRPTG